MSICEQDVHHMVQRRAAAWLDRLLPPAAVDVRRRGTAFIARAHWPNASHTVVIKPACGQGVNADAVTLRHAHDRLRMLSADAAPHLPRALDADAQLNCLVVAHVPGQSLADHLQKALRRPYVSPAASRRINAMLDDSARALAAVGRVSAGDAGVPGAAQRNNSYIHAFEQCWADDSIARFVPPGMTLDEALTLVCPITFRTGAWDRLLWVDAQPKNIIVTRAGAPMLIDPGFGAGNPALGLAQWLVSLDRIALHHPWPWAAERAAAWKRRFTAAFLSRIDPAVGDDLRFFYPWALMRTLRQHASQRPMLARYMARAYGRALREHLSALRATPREIRRAA